ncbi:DUF4416 family protein [candidate division KSB1 bacterium]|nr:DUF4416 family protein [candidate division KSB1 bacterium]
MGTPRILENVILIVAICSIDDDRMELVCRELHAGYGDIQFRSDIFSFTHTNYYAKEMGKELFKRFIAFKNPIDPTEIVDIKLFCNHLEDQFRLKSNRSVNIDPGYIEIPKLVLATTKNFSHRIYLGKGIYGDVQLYWRGGRFMSNPWTYADYKQNLATTFFSQVRTYLLGGV